MPKVCCHPSKCDVKKHHQNTQLVPKSSEKAEQQLLNEHIRFINNTLELYMHQKEACIHQLREVLDKTTMEECQELVNTVIEASHNKVLEHQRSKFYILYQQKKVAT